MSLEPVLEHVKKNFQEGDIDKALGDLKIAKEITSRDFRIFFYYGRCFIKKGDFGNAIENLEEAYKLNSVGHVTFYLAKAYLLNGNYLKALNLIESTIKLGISDRLRAGLNYFEAGAYRELGKRDESIKAAEKAVKFAPNNEEYQSTLNNLKKA